MATMVEVSIDSIRVSLMSQQRIVILRERDAERYLAIFIGVFEAEAITLALQDFEIARPLTWDLLKNLITELGARVLRVEVVTLREDTFYGNIVLETNTGRIMNVDSRPSDGLALAVRARVPIFVARSVMDAAGITPEEDMQAAPPARPNTPEPSEERLSVFEDFLESLDKGDTEADDDEEDSQRP
jgi:hypothetical protein